MPSKSKGQHGLMEAAAHGAKWAQKKVKSSVAKEFVAADKGKNIKALPRRIKKGRH